MHKQILTQITLPDGKEVYVSSEPEAWWTKDDATGYVDPRFLASDPDQPRKTMTENRLEELERSVATCGVREVITVTPSTHVPWVRLKKEQAHLPFVIVSGHRRTASAVKMAIRAVPVRIKIYEDENAHRTDGGVLNACRENLTELEQGFDFVRERAAGKTFATIADTHGINVLTVINRINLTRLHPDLFLLMEPDSKKKKRVLPIYPASILGGVKAPTSDELEALATKLAEHVNAEKATGHDSFVDLDEDSRRFAMQKLLAAVIMQRRLTSVRAAEFIRDLTLSFKAARHQEARTERYQPARRRDILVNLVKEVTDSIVVDWPHDEFQRIFQLASREEVESNIAEVRKAEEIFATLGKILSRIRDGKAPTRPEVISLMRARRVKSA